MNHVGVMKPEAPHVPFAAHPDGGVVAPGRVSGVKKHDSGDGAEVAIDHGGQSTTRVHVPAAFAKSVKMGQGVTVHVKSSHAAPPGSPIGRAFGKKA